jgi:UDP-GlcNAc:undecaprenyl-phosphate GlcNAc-1-phosphate transferase
MTPAGATHSSVFFNLIAGFITAFAISAFSIPSIIKIAKLKNLTDAPDLQRKTHEDHTPTLGGVAIFAALIFSVSFWGLDADFFELKYFLSSLIIMFFIGIKDDLYHFVYIKKLMAQLLSAVILVHFGGVRLTSLYRLFGVQDIPLWASYPLSVFTITVIINAFNLIDGANCLAAGIASVIALFYGVWYALVGYNALSLLAFCLLGALLGFMIYNRTPAKIFMGDTGSLLIGLVIALLTIKFIEYNRVNFGPYHIRSVPAVAIAILIVPLFDLARVFFIRLKNGAPPMHADRNHIHHRLIDLGFSHMQIAALLSGITALFTTIAVSICQWRAEGVLAVILALAVALTLWVEGVFDRNLRSRKQGGA